MGKPLLLLVLLLSLMAHRAVATVWDEPFLETINDYDSLPDDNVTALAQDQQGFLWVGTPNGLFRYDGYRFRRYANNPDDPLSLSGGFVRSLLVAADGRLWVGTNADGVSIFDPNDGTFTRLRHVPGNPASLSHDAIRGLAQTNDGAIWIATLNGLSQYRADGSVVRWDGSATAAPRDSRLLSLLADRHGNLWVGSWSGLDLLRPGSHQFVAVNGDNAEGPQIDGQSVRVVWADSGDRLWVGLLNGRLLSIDVRSLALVAEVALGTQAADALTVLAMSEPVAGEVWAVGLGGAAIFDPQSGRLIRRLRHQPGIGNGLATADVRALLIDRAGQLWLGGYSGGLQRYNSRNRALRMLQQRIGDPRSLSHPSVSAIAVTGDGRLFLGTRGNGIDLLDPQLGVIQRITADEANPTMLRNGVVSALALAADRQLWVGTDRGLHRVSLPDLQVERMPMGDGLPSETVRRLLLGRDGRLWVGTTSGVARQRDGGGFDALTDSDGQPVLEDVNALAEAADGRLWVGTAGDLYTVAPGAMRMQRVLTKPCSEPRSHRSVVGLLVDHHHRLWIDSPEGLDRMLEWDGEFGTFVAVSRSLDLIGQPFGANLLEDHLGRLWSPRWVLEETPQRLHALLRADGADLGTPWFRAYAQSDDGIIYYGGSQGLLRIDPAAYQAWDFEPPLVVTELRIDGRRVNWNPTRASVELDAGQQSFALEFAALDFSAPRLNRYRYRLLGIDAGWKETDADQRVASYSNLWPGEYQLRIEGSNRDGRWSGRSLDLRVRIAPKFWQTAWFLLLTVAIGGGLLYLAARANSRRHRRRALELATLVDQRTAELMGAKQRVESALEQLQQTQRKLLSAEKMAALGQLVAGVAHEINTPIGIALTTSSVIGTRASDLRQRLASGVRRSELEQHLDASIEASQMVESSLGRAARLVETFKQVSVERGSQGRQLFQLAPLLAQVWQAAAANWAERQVEATLECPDGIELDSFPGALSQVLHALADNALAHAFADRERPARIRLRVLPAPGERVVLCFDDNGCGIAADALSHIFEPFYTTRRAHGGTGLGLHIAFNLVTVRLGGDISVRSTAGVGSEFELSIPRRAPS